MFSAYPTITDLRFGDGQIECYVCGPEGNTTADIEQDGSTTSNVEVTGESCTIEGWENQNTVIHRLTYSPSGCYDGSAAKCQAKLNSDETCPEDEASATTITLPYNCKYNYIIFPY